MSDYPSSNDVVYRMYECHENEGWATASALLFEGAQTIERLTRERDELIAAVGHHVTVRSERWAQIVQLRAALERIRRRAREYGGSNTIPVEILGIANGALAGATPVETTAAPSANYRADLIRRLWETQCDDLPAAAKRAMAEAAMLLEGLPVETTGRPALAGLAPESIHTASCKALFGTGMPCTCGAEKATASHFPSKDTLRRQIQNDPDDEPMAGGGPEP